MRGRPRRAPRSRRPTCCSGTTTGAWSGSRGTWLEPHDGTGRVQLSFTVADGQDRDVRVPPGVTVFDSASWNGIAIDSTCGGHGTCHKCKVRVRSDATPVTRHDVRTFSPDELRDGWRLACRAPAHGELVIEVPPLQTRPK